MRRKEQEITDHTQIETVIKKARVCHLGLSDDNKPYVVPMCFGYKDNVVYFHCASEGMKIDILQKNPGVCLEFTGDITLETAEKACNFDMHYESVIAFGRASFITDSDEKKNALDILMKQYTQTAFDFPDQAVKHITIIKVEITGITGKKG